MCIRDRAGHVNGETRFVLDYFGMEEPALVEDVRTQVRDIEIRKTKGVADNISLKRAWNITVSYTHLAALLTMKYCW